MRVLYLIDSLGPGGAESLMPSLLKCLQREGVEPRVCVLNERQGNPLAGDLLASGIQVDTIPVSNLRNPLRLLRLFGYLRNLKPDIIHTQLETSDILGSLFAWLLGIPSLSTLHTLDLPSKQVRKYGRNTLRWNFLKKLAKGTILVSEFTRQHYLGVGFRESKLITVYNGIDVEQFSRVADSRLLKKDLFGLPEEHRVISTVAVLREAKGIQVMLQALPTLLAKFSELSYVIVGEGDQREPLQKLARSLGISEHVFFLGHRTDIPEILSASDLFVYPTLGDALPTALIEALAAGLPIVASRVGGVPEIITDGSNGLLVPPSDPTSLAQACIRLFSNKSLAVQMAAEGRATARNCFDVQTQAGNLMNIYNQIISGKKNLGA